MAPHASSPADAQAAPPSQWWVRPSQGGGEFGPVSPDGLVEWARGARVFPDDQVSPDRKKWTAARELKFLGMDTVIVPPTGRILGPFHPGAVEVLRAAGKVPGGSRVVTGAQILSGEGGGEAAEKAAAELREAKARAAALEEELEDVRAEAREALARKDAASGEESEKVRALEAQAAELRKSLAKAEAARAAAEAAAAKLREQSVSELEEARAEAAVSGDLRAALEAARKDAAEARAELARKQEDFDAADDAIKAVKDMLVAVQASSADAAKKAADELAAAKAAAAESAAQAAEKAAAELAAAKLSAAAEAARAVEAAEAEIASERAADFKGSFEPFGAVESQPDADAVVVVIEVVRLLALN